MNRLSILRQWPDGDVLKVSVSADAAYPDALDQARATLTRLYADACDVTLTDTTDEA